MSKSLFRTKKIESIIAEGSDDSHGGGGLKRVLTMIQPRAPRAGRSPTAAMLRR